MGIISAQIRTARKHHVCDFCGDTIFKSVKYCDMAYTAKGQIRNYKYHEECANLVKDFSKGTDDFVNNNDITEAAKHEISLCGLKPPMLAKWVAIQWDEMKKATRSQT